jgi:transketolase
MRKTSLDMVYQLAKRNPRVVFIGSDLGPGVLDDMKREMPDRFYMEGVQEQHVIGMAAGLAMEGYIPYVNTIATFLTRRCFEQLAVDLCLHNLPVRLIANGGGLVYAPLGPTHLAIEDMAILRALPNMTVVAPTDAEEMKRFMPKTLDMPGPIYIRLGKGGDPVVSRDQDGFEIGKGIELRPTGEVALITTGVMAVRALEAAEILERETGLRCGVVNMHTLKPIDEALVLDLAGRAELLVTIEEHTLSGGLGSAVAEVLCDRLGSAQPDLLRIGIPDRFPTEYGSQDSMMESFGLQPPAIAASVKNAKARVRRW